MIRDYKNGFQKGVGRIKEKDKKKFYKDVCEVFGVKTRTSYYRYVRGLIEPKISEAEALEKVFKKYGVTTNIWGNDEN
ncbi:MAG: hypothetical protein LBT94_02780 [Prevotellaceae bacterium]|jgi:hypothetical protein|nr:hypothetical protein [Prevotellaceae bacterium]